MAEGELKLALLRAGRGGGGGEGEAEGAEHAEATLKAIRAVGVGNRDESGAAGTMGMFHARHSVGGGRTSAVRAENFLKILSIAGEESRE